MKNTIVMLVAVATVLATWMFVSTIIWIFSDATFKQVASDPGMIIFMLIFGWIPSVIVCCDVNSKLEGE